MMLNQNAEEKVKIELSEEQKKSFENAIDKIARTNQIEHEKKMALSDKQLKVALCEGLMAINETLTNKGLDILHILHCKKEM